MAKISVIVPVYNAELYLERCIDSIISQTYSNLEIIIINDGSTDNSGKICDIYKTKDSRINVIHTKNRGQSAARNLGLDIAKGDYIAFVDSDDWVEKDIYKYSLDLIKKGNYDIVDFKCKFTHGEKEKHKCQENYNTEVIRGTEILKDYLKRGQSEKSPFSPCRKLYKKYLFDNVRFPEGKINEDIATNYKVLMNCSTIIHTDKVGYYYFQNGNSTTRGGLKKKDFDLIDACEELKKLSENENSIEIKSLVEMKYARSYFSLLAKIAFYGIDDDHLNKKTVVDELTKKLRKNYFLLIKSPMPLNRKVMISLVCIDIRLLSIPLSIYKNFRKERIQ